MVKSVISTFKMVRRFRDENIPVGEPDWDNSDASSDEDNYSE